MTIRRRDDWGTSVPFGGREEAKSDADIVRLQKDLAPTLRGGNLHRALGSPGMLGPGESGIELPVDALSCAVVTASGELSIIAASEVTVGSWYGRRGFSIVTSAGSWRGLDVAPASHPNDGRAEFLTIAPSMRWRARREARRRAVTGSHVPHPEISLVSVRSTTLVRHGRQRLFIDSVEVRGWNEVSVTVVPDALRIVV